MEKIKINLEIKEDPDFFLKMKREIEKSTETIRLLNELKVPQEVIERNIAKIYHYVIDLNYCKNCPGIKKCDKHTPTLVTKLSYKNGFLDRELVPCPQLIKRIMFEKKFLIRDFPEEWLDYDLRNLDKTDARMFLISQYSKFTKEGDNSWIYLHGSPNTGKSFSAAIITNDIAKKNYGQICYLNCPQRIRELSDFRYKEKGRFQEELNRLSNVPILVLDDFGNEYKSDMTRDEIIIPIILSRSNKRLFTIFTSDFKISEIVKLYSTSKPGEIRAKQIQDHIKTMVKEVIEFGDLPIY